MSADRPAILLARTLGETLVPLADIKKIEPPGEREFLSWLAAHPTAGMPETGQLLSNLLSLDGVEARWEVIEREGSLQLFVALYDPPTGQAEPVHETRSVERGHRISIYESLTPGVLLRVVALRPAEVVFGLWADRGGPVKHPLSPVFDAWQRRPTIVEPDRRPTRILPRIVAGAEHPDRGRGMLFGGPVRNEEHDGGPQRDLSLWPTVPAAKRVPLLDLVDLSGVPRGPWGARGDSVKGRVAPAADPTRPDRGLGIDPGPAGWARRNPTPGGRRDGGQVMDSIPGSIAG